MKEIGVCGRERLFTWNEGMRSGHGMGERLDIGKQLTGFSDVNHFTVKGVKDFSQKIIFWQFQFSRTKHGK